MTKPKAPTRLTVSGGPKVEEHFIQIDPNWQPLPVRRSPTFIWPLAGWLRFALFVLIGAAIGYAVALWLVAS